MSVQTINFMQPVYDKLINAGKTRVAGVVPSLAQGAIAAVHLLPATISLLAIGIIKLAASPFVSSDRLNNATKNCAGHTVMAASMLAFSVLNVLSLTYFNRNYL